VPVRIVKEFSSSMNVAPAQHWEQWKGAGRHLRNVFGGRMRIQLLLLVILMVTACAPQTDPTHEPGGLPPDTAVTSPAVDHLPTAETDRNPFAPKPGDELLTRGEVFLDETSLVIRESFPPQVSLSLKGNLPTPCHELRAVIAPADRENKIAVDVYSVVDPNVVCTQVLQPFAEFIDMGPFSSGHYTVWVNGGLAGEFDT
jgi:hypothetical protein